MKHSIETILEMHTPRQSAADRARLYQRVQVDIALGASLDTAIVSPFMRMRSLRHRLLSTMAVTLVVLMVGVGSTVTASESAKPGDLLFPIDRAAERVRLRMASEEARGQLHARFLDERFAELAAVIAEESAQVGGEGTTVITASSEARIVDVVTVLLNQAQEVGDADTVQRLRTLLLAAGTVSRTENEGMPPRHARFEIQDDRVDLHTDKGRIRADAKDGRLRIRYGDDVRDDTDDDNSKDDGDTDGESEGEDDRPAFRDGDYLHRESNERKSLDTGERSEKDDDDGYRHTSTTSDDDSDNRDSDDDGRTESVGDDD